MTMGYREIYERYRQNILAGVIKPGDKLPSIRVLAEELHVARKTVEAAYAVLVGEGYLVSRGAKGTLVNPDLVIPSPRPDMAPDSEDATLNQFLDLRDAPGAMRLGIPALDAFPTKKWLLLAGKAARSLRPNDMTNPPVMGYTPLREAIASYVNISRGLNCTADQVFITSGYRSNLMLILHALGMKSDKVVFEDPGYFFGQRLLKRFATQLHYAPVDRQGIDVDYLLRHHPDARFAIVTPSHHSPLAVTLSLPRKHQLLEWAAGNQSWIVEDDYDGEFHYTRKVLPALKSLDTQDRVIYIGTFSKTVMPAIRIGYIIMPRVAIARFREIGEIMEAGQPLLTQKILAAFLSEGHFYKHLKKMRTLYSQRRAMLLEALHTVYPGVFEVELSEGGMHIVAFLRTRTRDEELAAIWRRHQLQVSALSGWYCLSNKRYGLVMSYTNIVSTQQAIDLISGPHAETLALLS